MFFFIEIIRTDKESKGENARRLLQQLMLIHDQGIFVMAIAYAMNMGVKRLMN